MPLNDLMQMEDFKGSTLHELKVKINPWMLNARKRKWELQEILIFPPQVTMTPAWCAAIYFVIPYAEAGEPNTQQGTA